MTIKNLTCERDDRCLFENLQFSLKAGDILQVAGPNGAGKTTLLRILAGLSLDFDGDIFWCGQPVEHSRPDFLSSLLYLGHQAGIKSSMTPEENLRWITGLHTHTSHQKLYAALEKVSLRGYEDVPCYQLSAGQNRRVALARLYLALEKLWILDEPFTAIDRQGTAQLEQTLIDHARAGGMVIMTTHHEMVLDYPGMRKLMLGDQP